jgi:hypothetical protein
MINKLFYQLVLNFLLDKKAIAAPMLAGIGVTVLSMSFVAVDTVHYSKVKSIMQSCADNVTLNAIHVGARKATDLQSSSTLTLEEAFKQNAQEQFINCVNTTAEAGYISNISATPSYNATALSGNELVEFALEATADVKTYFSGSFGLAIKNVKVTSSASRANRPMDVLIAFSQQGTMCADTTMDANGILTIKEDPTCQKFTATKLSIEDSITSLMSVAQSYSGSQSYNLGLIPYTHTVFYPAGLPVPATLTVNETEDFFRKDPNDVENLDEITPLTSLVANGQSLINRVNALTDPLKDDAWGRIDLPVHVAAEMFKANITDTGTDRYLILMADGSSIGCCYTNVTNDFNNQYIYQYEPYLTHMLETCEYLKNNNVTIFTILLRAESEVFNTDQRIMAESLSKCSSTGDGLSGTYKGNNHFNVTDTEEIDNIFEDIISRMTIVKIDY